MVLRDALLQQASPAAPVSTTRVAIQCLEDRFYFGVLAAAAMHLRQTHGAKTELVIVRSISGAVGHGWQQALARSALFSLLISAQWVRAFKGIAHSVAYRSRSLAHPFSDALDWLRSHALWQREKTSPDISALQVLGVPVGDLIIDSYLRFRPAPRFNAADPFLRQLIWQAHRDVRTGRRYFRAHKPSAYLTSYSTYIEHGIATRVALQEGVRVFSFGNFQQFGKELTLSDWYHTPDTSLYRSKFEALDRQEERLAQADVQLSLRLSGGIDQATSYMRVSAYAAPAKHMPDVAGAVVLFLHDFYDSPHVYPELVFPDFWAWACFTIETLAQAGQKFFVKPHPNQISLSGEALKELTAKYPGLALLPTNVTNVQLADSGMLCGVTMYGTVAHELAYLGVPTIACARHTHHSFEFCRTARTIEQYRRHLLSASEKPTSREELRRQSLAFYYMHNLHGEPEELALRASVTGFWKACTALDTTDAALTEQFHVLRESAFKAMTEQLS